MNKNKKSKWIAIVALVFVLICPAWSQENKKIMAFVYDAGETFAFIPIHRKAFIEKNYDLQMVPLTPWSFSILKDNYITTKFIPKNLSQLRHVKSRYKSSNIDYWKKLLLKEKPHLVLLGMVSRVQGQLASFCKKQGIKTVAYYDSFDLPGKKSLVWKFTSLVDVVFVPTKDIAKALEKNKKEVYVVGQPSVEHWMVVAKTVKKTNIRRALLVPDTKRMILFAGQYGKDYEKVFIDFIHKAYKYKHFAIVIAPHPKTAGRLERNYIRSQQMYNISLVPPQISTATAAAASDLVITWTSTVGIQATFAGKPVIYYGLKPGEYSNRLIMQKIAFYATAETLDHMVVKALRRNIHKDILLKRLKKAGYVQEATDSIDQHLKLLLIKTK